MSSGRAPGFLLLIIYLGFISLGLPDGTFGVAWPAVHRDLVLPIGLAGTLVLVGTVLSAISSFSSGRIIARFKTGPVVLVSCVLTGSALLIIGQAQSLAWLLLAAAPLGFGAGAVDAGLNGYVARHYSGRHMNWLHACWGIGATCGPVIMAAAIGRGAGWRTGYTVLGAAQLGLAVVFLLTLSLWNAVPERKVATHAGVDSTALPTRQADTLAGWASAAIFALYVAVETTAGLWASTILVESRGVPPQTAGLCVSAYYGSITTGRLLAGFAVDRWGNRRIVAFGTTLALLGVVLFASARSLPLAAAALVLAGLGFAPVYPCLMHEVPRRFAPEAVQTVIGRQSGGAYVGAAALPALVGALAQFSLEAIAWCIAAGAIALLASTRWLDRITPVRVSQT